MSSFGEFVENILELLSKEVDLDLNQLKKKVNPKILDFMTEFGLIKSKEGKIIIGELGSALLIVERRP